MKKNSEDPARKFSRIAKNRHLDLNKMMREHFCSPETLAPKRKRNKKTKHKKK